QPTAEGVFGNAIMLARCAEPTVELVLIFLAVDNPDPQGAVWQVFAGREVAADCHAHGLVASACGLGASAGCNCRPDSASNVVAVVKPSAARDRRRVAPPWSTVVIARLVYRRSERLSAVLSRVSVGVHLHAAALRGADKCSWRIWMPRLCAAEARF